MPIEDVFSIEGRGTVVTGRVERGMIKVGEEVEIVGLRDTKKTTVTGVEMFRKLLDQGQAGDNIGALLRGTKKEEVERGQVLAKPGTITPHKKFKASVYVLSKDEGGRHTPFFKGYRPQFYFRTTDVTGDVTLPEGVEMVMPGDNIDMAVELLTPIAMEKNMRFAIREGGARSAPAWCRKSCNKTKAVVTAGSATRPPATPATGVVNMPRERITLACTECKRRNYINSRNKKVKTERLELKKYCPANGSIPCTGRPSRRERPATRRPVAQLAEHRSPKPVVGGSSPSWPATLTRRVNRATNRIEKV